jgi:hypothetical protein
MLARNPHQIKVPLVQIAHGRHQGDASYTSQTFAQFGNGVYH